MLVFDMYYRDMSQLRVNGSPIADWLKYNINKGFNVKIDAFHKVKGDKKLVSCVWLKLAPKDIDEDFYEKLQILANLSNTSFTFIYTHPEKNVVQAYKPQEVFERLLEEFS